MKQTAVEWLTVEAMKLFTQAMAGTLNEDTLEDDVSTIITKAKEMEKEQIVDAYEIGFAYAWDDARYDDEPKHAGAEHYYNETFNKSIKNKG